MRQLFVVAEECARRIIHVARDIAAASAGVARYPMRDLRREIEVSHDLRESAVGAVMAPGWSTKHRSALGSRESWSLLAGDQLE